MDWDSIGIQELEHIIAEEMANATPEEKALFARTAVSPSKWQLSPWGDEGGGFWVVAVMDDRVLWFNDIEDGFNVSRFTVAGTIPSTEYWCNQDELPLAIRALAGTPQGTFGPPLPARFEPLLLEFFAEPRVVDGWSVIGTDGGCELQVDSKSGRVRAFDPRGELPTRFVSSTVGQLERLITAYRRYCDGDSVAHLRQSLAEVDPEAIAHPDHWWSVVLEQAEDGLL